MTTLYISSLKSTTLTFPNFDSNFSKIPLFLIIGTEPCDSNFKPIK